MDEIEATLSSLDSNVESLTDLLKQNLATNRQIQALIDQLLQQQSQPKELPDSYEKYIKHNIFISGGSKYSAFVWAKELAAYDQQSLTNIIAENNNGLGDFVSFCSDSGGYAFIDSAEFNYDLLDLVAQLFRERKLTITIGKGMSANKLTIDAADNIYIIIHANSADELPKVFLRNFCII